jgi:tRNA (5-methylaminomethyl-2-thiouridylate)-methyltransferase
MNREQTVAVGLSGGVDSAVAAALLVERGYKVLGLTMKIWNGSVPVAPGAKEACFSPDEAQDVELCKRLCASLGIPYEAIDLSAEYEKRVLDYFRAEYMAGRTPNPCIVCNSELKFGFLIERAHRLGHEFDYFATGHYARTSLDSLNRTRLRRALDPAKDQSYFLYRLGPELLSKVLFPLGESTKEEVRSIARRLGLEVADKAESQDFIAGGDYSPLFADRPPEPGDIVDAEGRILGRHRGLPYYTIGQRRGLGISSSSAEGPSGADPQPYYVIALDPAANRVIVGPNKGLFADGLVASDFRLYEGDAELSPRRGFAKIRQNHRPAPCSFTPAPGGSCEIAFDESQRALAPGQSVVIYDEEGFVLGGGIIERAIVEGSPNPRSSSLP